MTHMQTHQKGRKEAVRQRMRGSQLIRRLQHFRPHQEFPTCFGGPLVAGLRQAMDRLQPIEQSQGLSCSPRYW